MNPSPADNQSDEQDRKQLVKAFAVLQRHAKLIEISDLKYLRILPAIRFLWIAIPILLFGGGSLYGTRDGTGTDSPDPPQKIEIRKIYHFGKHPDHVLLGALIAQKRGEVKAGEKLVVMETGPFGPTRSFAVSIMDAGEVHGIALLYTKTKDAAIFVPMVIKNSTFRVPPMSRKGLLFLLLMVQTNTDPNKIQLREA